MAENRKSTTIPHRARVQGAPDSLTIQRTAAVIPPLAISRKGKLKYL